MFSGLTYNSSESGSGSDDAPENSDQNSTPWDEELESRRNIGNPDSTPIYGHTQSEHGAAARKTQALIDRARSTEIRQGQWYTR